MRIPSAGEVAGLFRSHTSVDTAVKGIAAASKSLDAVAAHNVKQRIAKNLEAVTLHARAGKVRAQAETHSAEALRALRVATNLKALVA